LKNILFALLLVIAASVAAQAQRKGIEGVWSLTEVTTTGEKAATRQATQPSLYLFTKSHYSIIYVSSADARPEIDSSKASADELRSVFVSGFVANAGTYEVKGGKLTLHPMVAKSPGVMKSGNWSTMAVTMSGDMVTLVSEATQDGPAKNPTTFKLKRVE
jgi:hypothetical protein